MRLLLQLMDSLLITLKVRHLESLNQEKVFISFFITRVLSSNSIQKVEHVDGSAAEFVKNEAELIYTIKLNSLLKDDKTFYKDFIISEKIDSSLESIEKIQLVNEAGDLVGKVEMSQEKSLVKITEKDKVKGLKT